MPATAVPSSSRPWLLRTSPWALGTLAVAIGAAWTLARPRYLDLEVPFEPKNSAWAAKSYLTVQERPWNGGGTFFIVRLQGHARERQGWTREKAIAHFDAWLSTHGWTRIGDEQEGAGVFHHWGGPEDATHFRYQHPGTPPGSQPYVSLTVTRDRRPPGERMWNVVLESVNPAWWTAFEGRD
jgi:hypothetical protein